MVHAVIVVILAARCLNIEAINHDKIKGTDPREGVMEAFAVGYFIWDTLEETLIHYHDPMMAFHGAFVLLGLTSSFRSLFAYTCIRFLMMESFNSWFLNCRLGIRYLDKTGRTGTVWQLINGILLIVVFFFARIWFGSLTAYHFLSALYKNHTMVPLPLAIIYAAGIMMLMVFNYIWMYKMFAALQKRFKTKPRERDPIISR
ncbi:hypothetical protein M422DRAFT_48775 [Sphaerobolus stellatus SS14]|uniref:TLC domain-containing protein n=1 Tax=Sphaerobolus stellatus (strain SS14) TaxID=990650 RepID=A0A0C9UE82_SPHS4|nr:hypothetical protein M422DRAFT_48775 [Sphaerobolus stellatus SS14]